MAKGPRANPSLRPNWHAAAVRSRAVPKAALRWWGAIFPEVDILVNNLGFLRGRKAFFRYRGFPNWNEDVRGHNVMELRCA